MLFRLRRETDTSDLHSPVSQVFSSQLSFLTVSCNSCSLFSLFCAVGKMFKSLDLSLIVEFILMFYKDKPIDWLLDHILWVKVCNPEKDAVRK